MSPQFYGLKNPIIMYNVSFRLDSKARQKFGSPIKVERIRCGKVHIELLGGDVKLYKVPKEELLMIVYRP